MRQLVTNYFDKLIQIPIRVPPLGTQEVRAYMMLLFVEDSELPTDEQEAIRKQGVRPVSTNVARGRELTEPSYRRYTTTCLPISSAGSTLRSGLPH